MIFLAADPSTVTLFDFAGTLASASPPVMLAILIISLLKGWLVLPRELVNRDRENQELRRERDEYKRIAFQSVGLAERVVSVAEGRSE